MNFIRLTSVLILFLVLLVECTPKGKDYVGKKLKIRLEGTVPQNAWIKIDDILIRHVLPDSTKKVNPMEFRKTNVQMDEENGQSFSVAPSHTKIPISTNGQWIRFDIPRGMMVSSWIECLAINQKITSANSYVLDMPDYYAFEGYLIIERTDGNSVKLQVSKNLPISVEVLK